MDPDLTLQCACTADSRIVAKDGIAIYTSSNNVVLTAGIDGVVPPKYFAKVVKKDGQVLAPTPAA